MSSILSVLVLLSLLNQTSVHALLRSGSKNMADGGKDVYYRGKNRQDIDWRKVLTSLVRRFLFIVARKGGQEETGPRCLTLEDSFLPKVGGRKLNLLVASLIMFHICFCLDYDFYSFAFLFATFYLSR